MNSNIERLVVEGKIFEKGAEIGGGREEGEGGNKG